MPDPKAVREWLMLVPVVLSVIERLVRWWESRRRRERK